MDLPKLRSYRGQANKAFWDAFPRNFAWPGKSLINPDVLESLGLSLGLLDDDFKKVVNDVRHGASLGCPGEARLPSVCKKAASAYEFGAQVSDAIAMWVKNGFAHGPVRAEELASFVLKSRMVLYV